MRKLGEGLIDLSGRSGEAFGWREGYMIREWRGVEAEGGQTGFEWVEW